MPRFITKSDKTFPRVAGVLGIALATATPLTAWAHRPSAGYGFGTDTAGQPASDAYALTMTALVGVMIACLLGALLYFRWRAAHPLPEPDSVRSALSGEVPEENSGDQSWEKPADWWKSP